MRRFQLYLSPSITTSRSLISVKNHGQNKKIGTKNIPKYEFGNVFCATIIIGVIYMTSAQPKILRDFLVYLTTIKGKSMRTRQEYEYDLQLFFRFQWAIQHDVPIDQINNATIANISIEWLREITLEDLYLFMEYCEVTRKNSAAARARKAATLKSFFRYVKTKRRLIDENPAEQLETPKIGKRTPIYMNMEEATTFMSGVNHVAQSTRNYCIIMFFLNLGIRVTELCNLNTSSVNGQYITVMGKGNKERTIYLNDTCQQALKAYRDDNRYVYKGTGDEPLFISQKGTRLTRQTVAKIIKQVNMSSGLKKDKLTPHKLRHTSATMMYKAGADIRSLQHILGHTSVATTQIYTHIENEEMQQVIENNPFNKLLK